MTHTYTSVLFSLQELYHESYDNVCIMFASIVNFDEFFQMSSDYDKQIQCLRLLNEIIGDIDMVRDTDMVIRAASGLQSTRFKT